MNRKNRTWQPIDPAAGGLPEGLESALGDGDSVSACVVVLVDSEIDSEWGALASLAIAKRWAESGRRVILADACLDRPVLHEVAGVENGEGVSDVMLLGASLERIAEPLGERLFLVPAGTPVDQVADVLTHIEWDIVIRGCKRAGATLVFHVSTGTPGAQSLTERAEGVLVLAPSSQDLDTIVGSESGPLIAVLGPGNRGDPSAAGLPGPALADPAGEGFGSDETPEPAFAEPGGGDFSLDEEDALAVEGLPELPEEPPAFSVDDPPELPSSEGEDGETSDAFSIPRLEGSQYDVGDSRDAALEADVPEAEAVVSEAEESTEASGTAEAGDVGVGTADLDSGSDLEFETSVESETPLVEPVPVSDSLAEVRVEESPIEDALAVEGLPEEPPAFSVDDPPELPSSEGEDGETSDAFSMPSLGGSQYDVGDSRDVALEADAPEAGAVVSEAEESTEASGTAEGGDLGVGTADLDSGVDLEADTSVEGETPLVEPVPVSDSLAEVGADGSPIEDALAVEGLPEEPPAFSVDDPPELLSSEGEDGETSDAFSVPSLEGSQKRIWRSRDLPEWSSSEGEDGETSDAFSVPSLEGSQYDAGDSRDGALEADAPEAGAVVSEAEESTEASGTAEGGDLGVGTEDLDSGADLQVETSVEGETALVEPLPVSDSPAEVGAEDSPTEEPQGESTEEDAEAGRGYEGPARVEKWRKTERKTELRTKRETKLKTERKTGRKTGQKTEWHVLLVDDDDDDYSLVIERSLRSAAGVPVEIRRARTGGEALTVLGDFVPDLLLLDLKMPGMGGHEVLERIKGDDKLRSVPVAVLSSSDRDEDVAKSYGFGGNHFITKPSNPLVLEAKLGALLRNLAELGGIRRGSTGASTTAVSAVDPRAMTTLKVLRWVVVVGALIALYTFGKVSGAF